MTQIPLLAVLNTATLLDSDIGVVRFLPRCPPFFHNKVLLGIDVSPILEAFEKMPGPVAGTVIGLLRQSVDGSKLQRVQGDKSDALLVRRVANVAVSDQVL